MNDRLPPDAELAWDSFHRVVNMTLEELRAWLLTEASGEQGPAGQPDLGMPELGVEVMALLRKRKVDLTPQDVEVMRRVTDYVTDMESLEPPEGAQNSQWRWSLMTVGHDPLRTGRHSGH